MYDALKSARRSLLLASRYFESNRFMLNIALPFSLSLSPSREDRSSENKFVVMEIAVVYELMIHDVVFGKISV